ncbi:hypothetical protein JW777_10590 [bacterium]|nr:hypothetical protein [bacterium]
MTGPSRTRFFLAGIIQGSLRGLGVFDQSYRHRIKAVLRGFDPDCELVCPVEEHPESVRYTDGQARETFLANVERAKQCDAVIVYLPEASMGSSIEMWEAHRCGVPVLTVSPLDSNWVVRILSDHVFPDLGGFESFVSSGGLSRLLPGKPR